MTILAPSSLMTPAASKFLSYLSFSANFSSRKHNNKTHPQPTQEFLPQVPTCITIVMRKDGTPTTKYANVPATSMYSSSSSSSSKLSSTRTKRRSLSHQSLMLLSSPPKQRKLSFSSFIPRFSTSLSLKKSNTYGLFNSPSDNSSHVYRENSTKSSTINETCTKLQQEQKPFLYLPAELNIEILSLLDHNSLLNLSQTCRYFHKLCHQEHQYLWQKIFQSDYKCIADKQQTDVNYYDLYKNHFVLDKRWKYGQVNTRYLVGHEDSVYCLVWLKTNLLVSGSRDKSVKMWDLTLRDKPLLVTKTHHEGSVLCLRVSQDGSFLVSGSSDSTCLIWSLPDLEPQQRLVGHTGGVLDICIVNDYIVSSSRDATIRVWDRHTGKEVRRLIGHTGPVNALGSHQGMVVSASGDTTLKLWDIESGNCLKTFEGHTRGLACVKFDGKFVYSGGQDNKMKIWDASSGDCVSTLPGHSDLIRTIDSFEDRVVSGSYDKTLRVWSAKENKCLLSFQSGHSSWIFNCLLNRSKIVSAGQDKRIMVLDFGYDLTTID